MATNKTSVQVKKIPYYLLLGLLTVGASLLLGLLSFGGMYALIPLLPLAIVSFVLSVTYEGEIYLKNIQGALDKLFDSEYLETRLAQEYLLTVVGQEDAMGAELPEFFKDYKAQLALYEAYKKEHLDEESLARKKKIEEVLRAMEAWFARVLFMEKSAGMEESSFSAYLLSVQEYINKNQKDKYFEELKQRRVQFYLVGAWSALSALFMGIGTTYLAVEAFAVIPFFATLSVAAWPIIILPLACIAGAAYGMLTYNAITDLINHHTIQNWYEKLKTAWEEGLTWKNVLFIAGSLFLTLLAVALTICTAGTWWTIASNAPPLFQWMSKLPTFVMGIINPLVTGISSLFFNVQNTAESLGVDEKEGEHSENIFQACKEEIEKTYEIAKKTENDWQLYNPFRLLLKLIVLPLRLIFFIGHLVSIAVTTDRMPGVPQILAALTAFISEGFEDAHYFMGHTHSEHEESHCGDHHEHGEEGEDHHHHHSHPEKPDKTAFQKTLEARLNPSHAHNHDNDIPTRILKGLLIPVYFIAAVWDWAFSQLNSPEIPEPENANRSPARLSLSAAWDKQWGNIKEQSIAVEAPVLSAGWQEEYALLLENKGQILPRSTFLPQKQPLSDLAADKPTPKEFLEPTPHHPPLFQPMGSESILTLSPTLSRE